MNYSRQELVLGKKAQSVLAKKTITMVGIGALGTATSELLAKSGIGKLILIDRDLVEASNLQTQKLYTKKDIGKLKALTAAEKLESINPKIKITALSIDLDHKNLNNLKSDLVLDCTDNMEARFLIDYFCSKNKIPWIYSSAIQNKGYILNNVKNYSFASIFKNSKSFETCATSGILNSITSLISALQVSEAIKILLNLPHEKDMIYVNLDNNIFRKLKVTQKQDNKLIEKIYEKISSSTNIIKYCSSGLYQFKGNFKHKLRNKPFIKQKNLMIFPSRILITAPSKTKARTLYSKYIGD